ncbi:hypothetical protein SAMN02949497_3652 [Methylomagnum ishizawai]|uniref:UPF0235 protein SAMN02949497_3652 n=1 Tax=Methylomagnum ishizawai TaxID=1760988 RepID=A0A1Y6D1H3_9GAMM|nr:DUF167 family protein [Methylomagnum ishizawai]SMF96260.1 hypothetical protein SAMN02949497_3652 [Methylomagnum ishizawai]
MGGGFTWQGGDLILDLHVQPRAAKSEIAGFFGERLKIRIAAPPVDGKANQRVIDFLAETFAVPKRDVVLLAGESSRDKRVRIASPKRLPGLIPKPDQMD